MYETSCSKNVPEDVKDVVKDELKVVYPKTERLYHLQGRSMAVPNLKLKHVCRPFSCETYTCVNCATVV